MKLSFHEDRLDEILALDPEQDAQRIAHLIACYEFPWDTTRSLEIALFRTFCAPDISSLLDSTGEFRLRAQRRYDDTDILVSELLENGYDGARGHMALRRINQQHGRFAIANDAFLYVLSTFVFEPIRWNREFGWRPMTDTERLGWFHFWRGVGERMGIRGIPVDYVSFEAFSAQYESDHFRYVVSNQRVGDAVLGMFCGWFPVPLKPLVRSVILALLEDPVLQAFGFDPPHRAMKVLVRLGLRIRAALVNLLPKRRRPRLRTQCRHRTYPDGYAVERLGPPGT